MSKRTDILNAALELVVLQGVHNTPMSEVAKAAGTGMGTIYNYFPNKDLLINEIYVQIKEEEESLFLTVDTDKPIKTQFDQYLTVLINFFMDNRLYFMFLEQLQASPIITEENTQKGGRTVEMVSTLLKKGQQDQIIKNIPVNELITFIGGTVAGYMKWHFANEKTKPRSLKNHLRLVWDALKA